MAMDTGRGGGVQRFRPLFEIIMPYIEEWVDEHESSDPAEVTPALLVIERFDGLLARTRWLEEKARKEFGLDDYGFEAIVCLSGLVAASRRCGGSAPRDGAPPDAVTEAFLALWTSRLVLGAGVTAPQVAAAYFASPWSPPNGSPFPGPRWEPAGKALMAVAYKAVRHGLHSIANKGVPPLLRERNELRDVFEARVLAATHTIALCLTARKRLQDGCARSIGAWDAEDSTLWGFCFDAILGPGPAGGGGVGGRPLPGAFTKSLLGQHCRATTGVTVGTVEVLFCRRCRACHPDGRCPVDPSAVLVATSCRHRYVTPKECLSGEDRCWGHEKVRRNICKNSACVETLRRLLAACGRTPGIDQQPLYDGRLDACPYCGSAATRWQKTVWTRQP